MSGIGFGYLQRKARKYTSQYVKTLDIMYDTHYTELKL